jgi:phage gpG-like protein
MVTVALHVNGTQQLQRTLVRWANATADLRPAFEDIANRFAQMELAQFVTQGSSGGEVWSPLSPRYGAAKARAWPGRPILVRTGELRRQLTRRPFGVERITADSMHLGTSLPYARYHQTGTPRMPRRPPVNLTEGQRRELVKLVQAYLVSQTTNTRPRGR